MFYFISRISGLIFLICSSIVTVIIGYNKDYSVIIIRDKKKFVIL